MGVVLYGHEFGEDARCIRCNAMLSTVASADKKPLCVSQEKSAHANLTIDQMKYEHYLDIFKRNPNLIRG